MIDLSARILMRLQGRVALDAAQVKADLERLMSGKPASAATGTAAAPKAAAAPKPAAPSAAGNRGRERTRLQHQAVKAAKASAFSQTLYSARQGFRFALSG